MSGFNGSEVQHDSECKGHHCIRCGRCLHYDPEDLDMQPLLANLTDEEKATCVACNYPDIVRRGDG